MRMIQSLNERKYYKYIYEDWSTPVLNSNGVLGGDSFATSVTYGRCIDGATNTTLAYTVFDGNASSALTMWSSSVTTSQSLTFYNPLPISFETMVIYFYSNQYLNWIMKNGNLEGSNNGITWDTITTFTGNTNLTLTINGTNHSDYYNYYRLTGTLLSQRINSINCVIYEIVLNNTKIQNIVESTSSDYDFYKDPDGKVIKKGNKYFAFK